jgi:hypothetical protein
MHMPALVFVALVLIGAVAEARKEPVGWLDVQVSVPDAEIANDGKVYGVSPLGAPLKLYKGTHTIKVTRRGHSEFLDVIKIEVGKTTTLEVELFPLSAPVQVTSKPSGAIVLVDDQPVGTTPYNGDLEPGSRRIRVKLDGYLPSEKVVELVAGGEYKVDFPLAPEPPPPESLRKGPPRPFYKKWWFWAATSVVAVGVTALVITSATGDDPFGDADRIITPSW